MDEAVQQALRALPSVDEVVGRPAAVPLLERHSRPRVVEAVRAAVEAARREIMGGGAPTGQAPTGHSPTGKAPPRLSADDLLAAAATLLEEWSTPGLRRVANLSGVVIHTNLGRSPLAPAAVDRVAEVARGYCNLEYDLAAGGRGNRETYVEDLLTRLTGAEAAFVVNNNAGAVLLLLMALAGGREVLVSRGQLVEIGGSFRLPDIMRAGGVRLVEVGTTNRTRLEDYESAIGAETAMILRVHTSNYRVVGFTEEPDLGALVELGQRRGVIVADDLGSGALAQSDIFRDEPTVAGSLRTGLDAVCFSGDKLLGGPQAGILAGKSSAIASLRTHPVARALRLDKMSLAALEATLSLYLDPDRARREIPTVRFLSRGAAETLALAKRLQAAVEDLSSDGLILEVEESVARAGGGSMPLAEFPSHAVRIRFPEPEGHAARADAALATPLPASSAALPTVSLLDAQLRSAPLPVVARVAQDSLLLDVIALEEDDLDAVAESVVWAIGRLPRLDGGGCGTA